jgi:hypothetical protein
MTVLGSPDHLEISASRPSGPVLVRDRDDDHVPHTALIQQSGAEVLP